MKINSLGNVIFYVKCLFYIYPVRKDQFTDIKRLYNIISCHIKKISRIFAFNIMQNTQNSQIPQKQFQFVTNPKFGKDYQISNQLKIHLNALNDKMLIRYGISRFTSEYVFGNNYKDVLSKLYEISFKKLSKSPNTMHKYGSGDVIPKLNFDRIKQSLLSYIQEVYNIDPAKQCYLYTDFSVHYGKGFDKNLDEHVDDSDITINICLKNKNDFTGLRFNEIPDTLFSCKNTNKTIFASMNEGDILIHCGKQRHQVIKIEQYDQFSVKEQQHERVNLILWLKFKKTN